MHHFFIQGLMLFFMRHNCDLDLNQATYSRSPVAVPAGTDLCSPLRVHLLCINHLLLLILQELLLLVLLDLLELLQLLELALLLEVVLLLLLLLGQEVSRRLPVVAVRPHYVGASWGRCHAGRFAIGRFPGIGGREAVVALGNVCSRPHIC